MGTIAARKARQILDHAETVLGIELLCAAQGMTLRRPLTASAAGEAIMQAVRAVIDPLTDDRILHTDIAKAVALLRSGTLLDKVNEAIGTLD